VAVARSVDGQAEGVDDVEASGSGGGVRLLDTTPDGDLEPHLARVGLLGLRQAVAERGLGWEGLHLARDGETQSPSGG
jgi:hypothetical protein